MKKHYLLTLGLCGATCLSLVCVHSALAQTDSSSKDAETYKSEETTEDILFNDINGGQIRPMEKSGLLNRNMNFPIMHQKLNGGQLMNTKNG